MASSSDTVPAADLEMRLARREDVITKEIRGEGALLDMESGDFFDLNAVGLLLWRALDGNRTLREHAREIGDHFQIPSAEAEADLLEFAGELLSRRLVVIRAG